VAKEKTFQLVFATKSDSLREYLEKRPGWTHTVSMYAGTVFHVVFQSYDWRWLEKLAALDMDHPDVDDVFIEYTGQFKRGTYERANDNSDAR